MKFFLPFVEPQHAEAVLARIAKGAHAEVPERRLRTLYYTQDSRNRSATVGKALRDDGRIVVAILPLNRGGYGVFTSDPDGVVRKSAPVVIAPEALLSVKHFDAPTDPSLHAATDAGDVQKRLAARRQLFGKVQATADADGIAWGDALRKILINPANLPLLAQAQEPRKPRAPRQRLSDAELEKRIRQLEGSGDDIRKTNANSDVAIKPVRKSDGTVDEVATSIKKIHTTGGTVEAHRRK